VKILGIDTSTKFLSLSVAENNDCIGVFNDKGTIRHSSLLVPAIEKLLKKSALALKSVDAIALSIGPGSFTGLRIGVATCKGINLALGIPIVAVPTLEAVAYNFRDEKERLLCPLIDAKKQKVYTCFYKTNPLPNRGGSEKVRRVSDYMLLDIDSLLKKIKKPTLVFGDAVKLYGERCKGNPHVRISTKEWHPKAEVIAKLGLEKAIKKKFANPDKLVPMYLHSKYCQVKK
jgi:tRNA threonylcarbamoyl adenosine modification protein YeaZ